MKRLARIVAAGAALFALLCLGAYALIESGEVIVIHAAPEDGGKFLARLWVVDGQGSPWISTTDPDKTDWVPWLRAHPVVEFERDGIASCRQSAFIDDPDSRRRLNALLNAKYRIAGYGSRFLKMVGGARHDEEARVWIRLDPCAASP